MEVLRVVFTKPIVIDREYEPSVASLLISKDIKECLKGLYEVIPDNYAIINPYMLPNIIEIYNFDSKQIDLIVKRFFSSNRKIEILGCEYEIKSNSIQKFIWHERVLKGFSNSRRNRYKTINPIFLKDIFNHPIVLNSHISVEEFKELATFELKKYLSSKFGWFIKELILEWESFNITFSKCSLQEKNQICFYGVFKTNFVPPIFVGDFTENGCGKIILIKDESLKVKKAKSITLYFEEDYFKEVEEVSRQNNLDVLSFTRLCLDEKIDEVKKDKGEEDEKDFN